MSRQPVRTTLGHVARGLLMGGADVVPGVSGGTVALILGIYERLIRSIREVASAPVRLLRGDVAAARTHLAAAEWGLVLPLGAGIVTALGIGSVVIPPLMERHPVPMLALFLGLVLASVPIPFRRIERVTSGYVLLMAGAAVVAFALTGLPAREGASPSTLQVFAAASVAICAMILPGVSGAFLLKAMGMYEVTLNHLRDLDVVYVGTFALGAAVGLGVFARLLSWLLDRHHDRTMAALVGLMIGALRALWPWQRADRGLELPFLDASLAVAVALMAAGFAAVTLLTRLGDRHPEDVPLP
jgi:putative membrane protein